MTDKYTYRSFSVKKIFRLITLCIFLIGIIFISYIFFPLISWQLYFAPAFAQQNVNTPIPKAEVLGSSEFSTLVLSATDQLRGVDYTNAENWFPNYRFQRSDVKVDNYLVSIPSINIKNANVSTIDNNLAEHLVNFQGSVPPDKGNVVIFGHSTLPQLFDARDYKTILANAYKMKTGDEILTTVSGVTYKYIVTNIKVVEPNDVSVLSQNYEDSYLTLITCTPPGTIWKRLIIKAALVSK